MCTPTEAAAVSCVYSFIVSIFIYKELKLKDLPKILVKSAQTTAYILIVVAASSPFQWFMTSTGIVQDISASVLSVLDSRILILLIINMILLFLGCFLEIIGHYSFGGSCYPSDCYLTGPGSGVVGNRDDSQYLHWDDYAANGSESVCIQWNRQGASRRCEP